MINSVKGTALGVAEYLTPVLKVTNILSMTKILLKNPILGIKISRNGRIDAGGIRRRR